MAPHSQLAGAVTAAGDDLGAAMCVVRLRRWENQRRLASYNRRCCSMFFFQNCNHFPLAQLRPFITYYFNNKRAEKCRIVVADMQHITLLLLLFFAVKRAENQK